MDLNGAVDDIIIRLVILHAFQARAATHGPLRGSMIMSP